MSPEGMSEPVSVLLAMTFLLTTFGFLDSVVSICISSAFSKILIPWISSPVLVSTATRLYPSFTFWLGHRTSEIISLVDSPLPMADKLGPTFPPFPLIVWQDAQLGFAM